MLSVLLILHFFSPNHIGIYYFFYPLTQQGQICRIYTPGYLYLKYCYFIKDATVVVCKHKDLFFLSLSYVMDQW